MIVLYLIKIYIIMIVINEGHEDVIIYMNMVIRFQFLQPIWFSFVKIAKKYS